MHRLVAAGGLLSTACAPSIAPPWLVDEPRELAMAIELVAQGPYGARVTAGPRSFRDALPLDTLSLRPVVVDGEGPIDPAALEGAWILCAGVGSCLLRGSVSDSAACAGDELQPSEPCRFGEGGEATLRLADVPPMLPPELPTVFNLISGPTVGLVASPPGGPGVASCMARLDNREPLGDCLLMERTLGIGPLGDLARLLEELGIDPGIEEGAETLLARPRNRNPAVEQLLVDQGDDERLVDAGTTIVVPRDRSITLSVETSDEDLDGYETMLGEETVLLTEDLGTQWWFDRELELEEAPPGQLWARVRAGSVTGAVRAYVVLRDDRGGEGWGWITLDFAE